MVDHHPSQVSTGILHHLNQLDVKVVDHRQVDLDHVLFGDPGHVVGSDRRIARWVLPDHETRH